MENKAKGKKIKTFWAITLVVVAALIAGGIIYFNAQSSMVEDDIYSAVFIPSVRTHKTADNTTKSGVQPTVPAVSTLK